MPSRHIAPGCGCRLLCQLLLLLVTSPWRDARDAGLADALQNTFIHSLVDATLEIRKPTDVRVFVHQNKNGGTSIKGQLQHLQASSDCETGVLLLADQCPNGHGFIHGPVCHHHLHLKPTGQDLRLASPATNELGAADQAMLQKVKWIMGGYAVGACEAIIGKPCTQFTIFRHPVSRLVSAYDYCHFFDPQARGFHDQLCGRGGFHCSLYRHVNETLNLPLDFDEKRARRGEKLRCTGGDDPYAVPGAPVTRRDWAAFPYFSRMWSNFAVTQLSYDVTHSAQCNAQAATFLWSRVTGDWYSSDLTANVMRETPSLWYTWEDVAPNKPHQHKLLVQLVQRMSLDYDVVGLLEEFEASVDLIRATVNTPELTGDKHSNSVKHVSDEMKPILTNFTCHSIDIKRDLWMDMILYARAVQVFSAQAFSPLGVQALGGDASALWAHPTLRLYTQHLFGTALLTAPNKKQSKILLQAVAALEEVPVSKRAFKSLEQLAQKLFDAYCAKYA